MPTATLCMAIAMHGIAVAQTVETNPWFTRAAFTPAYIIPTNHMLVTAPPDRQVHWTPSTSIEIGRQTDGSREWHHLYGFPSYGVGMSVASFGTTSEKTRPVDAYTFFSWPFAHPSERVRVTTDFGMGLSWNWTEIDPQTNTRRNVLTSDMNVRIDWGFYLRYSVTPQTSVYAGIDYTHRSNGGMRQPDEGINVIGPRIVVRYDLAPERERALVRRTTPFHPNWELLIGGSGGIRNINGSDSASGDSFGVLSATAALQRHFYRYGKIAVGSDMSYGGAPAQLEAINRLSRTSGRSSPVTAGIYGGYEHLIGRFGALVQAGYKVADTSTDGKSRFYGRYGWRFYFNDRLWGLFAVRAIEGRKADFIEFGAGYRKSWH